MSDYAGRSQEQRIARETGGEMAWPGTEADKAHSCGELTERGKQIGHTGSGIDGGGKT